MAEFDDKEGVSEEIDMAALRARLEATAEDPELPDDLKAMYSTWTRTSRSWTSRTSRSWTNQDQQELD